MPNQPAANEAYVEFVCMTCCLTNASFPAASGSRGIPSQLLRWLAVGPRLPQPRTFLSSSTFATVDAAGTFCNSPRPLRFLGLGGSNEDSAEPQPDGHAVALAYEGGGRPPWHGGGGCDVGDLDGDPLDGDETKTLVEAEVGTLFDQPNVPRRRFFDESLPLAGLLAVELGRSGDAGVAR